MTATVARLDRTRQAEGKEQTLAIAHQRLMVLMLLFSAVAFVIALRLLWLTAFSSTAEARSAVDAMMPPRADIVDRNGEVLARTMEAWSIGVHPNRLLNKPEDLAPKLAALMPERTEAQYLTLLRSRANFTYLRRRAMPELVAKVNALGEPGMAFSREPERLYPQLTLAAHVLGYTDMDGHGVMGMERVLDTQLSDPATGRRPIALSIDKRVQAAMESELSSAMQSHQAIGATGLVMDVRTGELIAMVSLPVFNPNNISQADPQALRNNVTQSVYELGSTFKPITIAGAMDDGIVTSLSKRYDATNPIEIGKFKIKDDHPMHRWLNVPETLVHSSNIATAKIAEEMGAKRMEALFRRMEFYEAPKIELREKGRPLVPSSWARTTTMTTAYGHGIAVTPLQLASAYAALVNGGILHRPTLLKVAPDRLPGGKRVFSRQTSDTMRMLLRLIVTDGTGKKADVLGMRVGGKTGTAEKPSAGGYSRHVNVSTFAAAFPMDAPRYVVVAMLDAPKGNEESHGLTTAAWTAAPVVSKVIARTGPMLGVFPDPSKDMPMDDLRTLIWKDKADPE
ncbi:MAG: peptidoglycan D,D-transpeptidase FtsI family protein [Chakrabartia sp.]